MKNLISLAFIAALASGCGVNTPGKAKAPLQNESPSTFKTSMSGQEFLVLEAGTLESSGDLVKGRGTLVFKAPRPNEDSNFDLSFALSSGSSVSLTTNSNEQLQAGVTLIFKRTDRGLNVQLKVGAEIYDLSPDFLTVNATQNISLNIDVHAHGHIVFFLGNVKLEYAFSTNVPGRFWGLRLEEAEVSKAAAGAAKVQG